MLFLVDDVRHDGFLVRVSSYPVASAAKRPGRSDIFAYATISGVSEPCICVALRRLARKATALYDAELRAAGVTLTQYSAMIRLARLGTCTLSELATEAGLDVATLSRKVAPLIASDWISVGTAGDRRAKRYALTAEGKRVLRRAQAAWRRAQANAKRVLRPERVAEILRLSDAFGELAAAHA